MKLKTACIGLRRSFAAMGVSVMGVSAVGVSAVGVYQQYMHFGKLYRYRNDNYKGSLHPSITQRSSIVM